MGRDNTYGIVRRSTVCVDTIPRKTDIVEEKGREGMKFAKDHYFSTKKQRLATGLVQTSQ